MKKKNVVAFLATFFILTSSIIILAQPAAATPTADSLGVGDVSGDKGTYVIVPVNITNVKNGPILGIGFEIAYDKDVINVTDVSKGNLTSKWALPNVNNNFSWGAKITIAGFHEADAIPNEANGSVVLLNFSVVGLPGDISPMNMTPIELSNPDGFSGTAPAKNGTFTVISPGADITPPKITITFPLNGSTLGILNNSVIGRITDESALETAYLTLNDNSVTNLTKELFNVKVSYIPNATNKIKVFAMDIAGNTDTTGVQVSVLPNIVVVNKTTVPNENIEIDAKNATNTVIELNATIVANVTVTIKANTNASALNAEPATSTSIYRFTQNQNLRSVEKYIDVNVTGIDKANITFVSLKLYYTTADLDRNGDGDADDPGDLNVTTLKLYWFNPNTRLWMPLGPDADEKPDYTDLGGPKVIDDERNTNEKYVKVTLNHFSTFALVAEEMPAPVTPTPIPSGGGGAFIPALSPTPYPVATLTPTETAKPTLAPTITPPATSTQTPTPTPAPVHRPTPLFSILIVIAVIVIAGITIMVLRGK